MQLAASEVGDESMQLTEMTVVCLLLSRDLQVCQHYCVTVVVLDTSLGGEAGHRPGGVQLQWGGWNPGLSCSQSTCRGGWPADHPPPGSQCCREGCIRESSRGKRRR
jgi:hypothetical protein